jgi:hypothetical protein
MQARLCAVEKPIEGDGAVVWRLGRRVPDQTWYRDGVQSSDSGRGGEGETRTRKVRK